MSFDDRPVEGTPDRAQFFSRSLRANSDVPSGLWNARLAETGQSDAALAEIPERPDRAGVPGEKHSPHSPIIHPSVRMPGN